MGSSFSFSSELFASRRGFFELVFREWISIHTIAPKDRTINSRTTTIALISITPPRSVSFATAHHSVPIPQKCPDATDIAKKRGVLNKVTAAAVERARATSFCSSSRFCPARNVPRPARQKTVIGSAALCFDKTSSPLSLILSIWRLSPSKALLTLYLYRPRRFDPNQDSLRI